MPASNATPSRAVWMLIFASMANAVVLYGILLYLLRLSATAGPPGPHAALRPFFYLAAGLLLAVAVLWARLRLAPTVDGRLRAPAEFQTASIAGLAIAEAPAILGFVHGLLGAPLVEYLPFGLGALVVMLAFHLPAGLAYWQEWENAQGPGPRPLG